MLLMHSNERVGFALKELNPELIAMQPQTLYQALVLNFFCWLSFMLFLYGGPIVEVVIKKIFKQEIPFCNNH